MGIPHPQTAFLNSDGVILACLVGVPHPQTAFFNSDGVTLACLVGVPHPWTAFFNSDGVILACLVGDRKPACLSSPVIKTGLRVSEVRFPPARGSDLCESNGKERAFKGCMPPARRFTYPPHHKKGRAAKA